MISQIARRLRREDDGVLLVMTLAFLAVLGLFCSVVLGYAETNLRAHETFESLRDERYAADGALEAAIEVLRDDLDAGRDPSYGGACPDTEPFASFAVNGQLAEVTCSAEPSSGAPANAGSGSPVVPEHVLLALGDHPDEGIVRDGAASLTLEGSMFSHSRIHSATGLVTTAGKVYAVGPCTGYIVSLQPPLQCAPSNGVSASDPLGADPSFEPMIRFAPADRIVPSVPMLLGLPDCTGSVFTLQPGRYSDARALTRLTTLCPSATIHLAPAAEGPGIFYFDFEQEGAADDVEDHVWRIEATGVKVVGGTPKNWIAGAPAAVPGACATASDPAPNHGVQMIFGGNSRVDLRAGAMEVCADSADDEGAIAVYGMPTLPPPVGLASGEDVVFAGFSGADRAEGGIDDAWTSVADESDAKIEVGFTTTVPAGATIGAVSVKVRHRESENGKPQLVLIPGDGSGACAPIALTADTTAHTDGAAGNASSCINSPAKLNGMRARFQMDATDRWAKVDGFTLEVSFTGTELEPLSNCLLTEPYASAPATGASGPCPVLHTAPGSILAIQGTVYAPSAPVHLELGLASVQTVSHGIIGRTIRFDATVGVAIPGNPIGVPGVGARSDREVRINVALDGVPKLEALVRFGDGGGITPGATVDIVDWTFLEPS